MGPEQVRSDDPQGEGGKAEVKEGEDAVTEPRRPEGLSNLAEYAAFKRAGNQLANSIKKAVSAAGSNSIFIATCVPVNIEHG